MATTLTPASTTLNVGEESGPQVSTASFQIHQGPPPEVHRFMKRKFRRCCCCLTLLLILNLIMVSYVARQVTSLTEFLSPDSEVKYMPGGFKPFCSDLCVNLCLDTTTSTTTNNDNSNMNSDVKPHHDFAKKTADVVTLSCEVKSCLDSCAQYFENNNDGEDVDNNGPETSQDQRHSQPQPNF